MQQAFGRIARELLVDHPEHFGRDRFELKMSSINDAARALRAVGSAAFELRGDQTAFAWQRLRCAGCHFTQRRSTALPSDDMTAVGDVDPGRVEAPLNATRLMHAVEFWMQRARKNSEGEFSNFGANRKHYSNLIKALGMNGVESNWITFIDDHVKRIKIVIVRCPRLYAQGIDHQRAFMAGLCFPFH